MRYTKYKYKKNNEGTKLLISVIVTMALAIFIGNLGAKFILKMIPKDFSLRNKDINEVIETNTEVDIKDYKEITYSVIQSGYFSKKENANSVLSRLSSFENAFIYEDEVGKFRVIVDVVKEEDAEEVLQALKESGIESAKVDYSIKEGENEEGHVTEIIKGQFEIINTFKDETVKEIDISEFKSWVKSLEISKEAIDQGEVIKSEENENTEASKLEVLNTYKEYIENMPNKVERKNVKEDIKNIYSVIIKLKR